jgi:hypothetical protein
MLGIVYYAIAGVHSLSLRKPIGRCHSVAKPARHVTQALKILAFWPIRKRPSVSREERPRYANARAIARFVPRFARRKSRAAKKAAPQICERENRALGA